MGVDIAHKLRNVRNTKGLEKSVRIAQNGQN